MVVDGEDPAVDADPLPDTGLEKAHPVRTPGFGHVAGADAQPLNMTTMMNVENALMVLSLPLSKDFAPVYCSALNDS